MDDALGWIREHTTLVMALLGGLVLAFVFLKKPAPTNGTVTNAAASTSGLQTDANGNPIVFRDVADKYVNIVSNSNNTVAPSAPQEFPYEPTGVVRPAETSAGPTYQFDQQHQQGVPIRATPDPSSQIVSYVPYGSTIQTTGGAVTGANNILGAGTGIGSNLWYPTHGGYISSFDLTSLSTGSKTAGGQS